MQITVRLLASYHRYLLAGHNSQDGYPLHVPAGATVSDVLPDLPIPPDEACTFFINGRHAQREQVLKEGDILAVFPAVGGG